MSKTEFDIKKIEAENRLSLFEGVIIGIYGNWLVTLIQMISFISPFIIIQLLLTTISLLSFVALVAVGIFGGKLGNKYEVVILSIGHFLPNCITLIMERLLVQDAFFLFVGGLIFYMIFHAEYVRVHKYTLKKKTDNT
jgi:hypothetical protein